MRIADYDNGVLLLKFFGNDFESGLAEVKELTSPYFIPAGKFWTAPYVDSNIQKLKNHNWIFTEKLNAIINSNIVKEVIIDESKLEGLFPFQKEAVKWLESRNGTGLIALVS